jgi:hypothetical protein
VDAGGSAAPAAILDLLRDAGLDGALVAREAWWMGTIAWFRGTR